MDHHPVRSRVSQERVAILPVARGHIEDSAGDLDFSARDLPQQAIAIAQEVINKWGGWIIVNLCRRAALDGFAVVHDYHAVRYFECFLLVVRDEDAGYVDFIVEPTQPVSQLQSHFRVESAEGFVEQ